MKVITNNHPRELIMGYEISEEALIKDHYSFMSYEDLQYMEFVWYKNQYWALSDFIQCNHPYWGCDEFTGWDGYFSLGYVGGIVMKWYKDEYGNIDYERVIMGWY